MNRIETIDWLHGLAEEWVDDPESDVVYCEQDGNRLAVRMRQQTRDFTTVWFEVGDRSLRYEAYVLPEPPLNREEVYRICLIRNDRAWRAHFALDRHGDVYLRGRLSLEVLSENEIESALGEIYELVEITFRPLLRAGFRR
jgi:hypothetical protein